MAAYRKDAARELDREKKRLAREEKDRLRKEAEARKQGRGGGATGRAEARRAAACQRPGPRAGPAPVSARHGAGRRGRAGGAADHTAPRQLGVSWVEGGDK